MLLVIDVGNSHTVFGVYDGPRLAHHFRMASDRERTGDEYAVLLREMLADAGVGTGALRAAIVASVVPPLTPVFERMCAERLGLVPVIVGPGVKTGMPILYESPREVGADRIVNGVAGYERLRALEGGPYGAIIVDFGTATTFDVVSPKGEYLGGAIAPGVQIAADALFQRAAKLPRIELAVPASSIGRNTVHSMQAGVMLGYVGLVEGMVARMRRELDFAPRVLATGGLATLIAPEAPCIEEVVPFLTLDGLRIIFERQHERSGGRR